MCSLLQTHSKKGLFITYPLKDGKNSIGISLDADIRLKGVGFQLEHCVIYCRNNEAELENKSEDNPVVLNGAILKTTERLRNGDRITINGKEFEFSQPTDENTFDFISMKIQESFTPSMKMKTITSTSKIPLPTRIPTRKNVSLSASKLPIKSATTKSNYNNKGVMTPPNLRTNRRSRSTGKITKLGKHPTPKPSLRVSLFKKNLRLDKESPPDCFNNVTKLQTTPELIDLTTPASICEERKTRSQFEEDNLSTPKAVKEESAIIRKSTRISTIMKRAQEFDDSSLTMFENDELVCMNTPTNSPIKNVSVLEDPSVTRKSLREQSNRDSNEVELHSSTSVQSISNLEASLKLRDQTITENNQLSAVAEIEESLQHDDQSINEPASTRKSLKRKSSYQIEENVSPTISNSKVEARTEGEVNQLSASKSIRKQSNHQLDDNNSSSKTPVKLEASLKLTDSEENQLSGRKSLRRQSDCRLAKNDSLSNTPTKINSKLEESLTDQSTSGPETDESLTKESNYEMDFIDSSTPAKIENTSKLTNQSINDSEIKQSSARKSLRRKSDYQLEDNDSSTVAPQKNASKLEDGSSTINQSMHESENISSSNQSKAEPEANESSTRKSLRRKSNYQIEENVLPQNSPTISNAQVEETVKLTDQSTSEPQIKQSSARKSLRRKSDYQLEVNDPSPITPQKNVSKLEDGSSTINQSMHESEKKQASIRTSNHEFDENTSSSNQSKTEPEANESTRKSLRRKSDYQIEENVSSQNSPTVSNVQLEQSVKLTNQSSARKSLRRKSDYQLEDNDPSPITPRKNASKLEDGSSMHDSEIKQLSTRKSLRRNSSYQLDEKTSSPNMHDTLTFEETLKSANQSNAEPEANQLSARKSLRKKSNNELDEKDATPQTPSKYATKESIEFGDRSIIEPEENQPLAKRSLRKKSVQFDTDNTSMSNKTPKKSLSIVEDSSPIDYLSIKPKAQSSAIKRKSNYYLNENSSNTPNVELQNSPRRSIRSKSNKTPKKNVTFEASKIEDSLMSVAEDSTIFGKTPNKNASLFEESPTSALNRNQSLTRKSISKIADYCNETTSKTPRKSLSIIKESLEVEQIIDPDTVEVQEIETCTTKRSSRKHSKLIEFEEIGPRGAKRVRESTGECLQENKKFRMETTGDFTLESSVAEDDLDIFTCSQEYLDDDEDDSDSDIANNRSIKNATIENSFNVNNIESVQNNITINIHTHKSISNISGIKELFETTEEPNSPTNDLCNVEGVKRLFKTPKKQKTPLNDLSKVDGVKRMFKTPKVQKSPLNDLSNVVGIRKVFTTPKVQKSPLNDLTKIVGVKKMFNTPPKQQKSPINDLTKIVGVKQMFTTPKQQKSPKNDLTRIDGVKTMFQTRKEQTSPRIEGVKQIFKTPKVQKPPRNDLTEVFGVKTMMTTPKQVKSPLNDLSNVTELDSFFRTPLSKMTRKTDEQMDEIEEDSSIRKTGNEEEMSKPTRIRTRQRKAVVNVEETVSTPVGKTRNKRSETSDIVASKDEHKPTRQRKTDKNEALPETEQPSETSELSKNEEKPIRVTRQRKKAAIEDDVASAKPTTTRGRRKQLNNNDTDRTVAEEMDNVKKSKRNLQVEKNFDKLESSTPVLREDEDNENSSRPRTRRGRQQNIKPEITENLTPIPKRPRKTVDKIDENDVQIESTELQPRTRRGRNKNTTIETTSNTPIPKAIEKSDETNESSTPLKKSRGRNKKAQKSSEEVVEEQPIRVTRQKRNVAPENDDDKGTATTTTRSTRRRKLDSIVDSENESSTKRSTRNKPTESGSSRREKKVEENETTRTEGRILRSRKK